LSKDSNLSNESRIGLLAKCVSLIDRARTHLAELDNSQFPTPATDRARDLIDEYLSKLQDRDYLERADAPILYEALLTLPRLLEFIDNSNVEEIALPIVKLYQKLWMKLVEGHSIELFYYTSLSHNYTVESFTKYVETFFNSVFTEKETAEVNNDRPEIWCLSLSQMEGEHLPMYAMVVHEFGHVVFTLLEDQLIFSATRRFDELLSRGRHAHGMSDESGDFATWLGDALKRLAQECFCDILAAKILGISYLAALYELAWGNEPYEWIVSELFGGAFSDAHPSTSFRLTLISQVCDAGQFLRDAEGEFKDLEQNYTGPISEIIALGDNTSTREECTILGGKEDKQKAKRIEFLNQNLDAIKDALLLFSGDVEKLLTSRFNDLFEIVNPSQVNALLDRMEKRFPPDLIQEDWKLPGKPACYAAIFTASALFRLSQMIEFKLDNEDFIQEWRRAGRLTLKAFESSDIAQEYWNQYPWNHGKGKERR